MQLVFSPPINSQLITSINYTDNKAILGTKKAGAGVRIANQSQFTELQKQYAKLCELRFSTTHRYRQTFASSYFRIRILINIWRFDRDCIVVVRERAK